MITVNRTIKTALTEQVFKVYYKNPDKDPKIGRIGHTYTAQFYLSAA